MSPQRWPPHVAHLNGPSDQNRLNTPSAIIAPLEMDRFQDDSFGSLEKGFYFDGTAQFQTRDTSELNCRPILMNDPFARPAVSFIGDCLSRELSTPTNFCTGPINNLSI
jgi:hypothetical protein